MYTGAIQKWPIIFVTIVVATPQFPMPYPMYGQLPMIQMMQALPSMLPAPASSLMQAPSSIASHLPPSPPVQQLPMQMQIGLAIVSAEETTSTATETTTTTDKSKNDEIAVALPMPMPMPIPAPIPMPIPAPSPVLFAVPGMMSSVCMKNKKHPNCPPCPPCSCSPCTPSFFSYCSSCHQKCRCRNAEDVPLVPPPKAPFPLPGPAFPMPYPGHLPNSPDVAFVPYPPHVGLPKRHKSQKFYKEDSDSDSCENYRTKKNKKHKDYGMYRRSNRRLDLDRSDNMVAKPVLNFLSSDGRVKLERRLNKIDASLLLSDDDSSQIMHKTNFGPYKKVISYPYEEKGRKKMVFRPPPDMMVGNLSVSFNTKK